MYACASASGEPRVPILTVLVATAAATTIEAPRRAEEPALARRGAATAGAKVLTEVGIERLRCFGIGIEGENGWESERRRRREAQKVRDGSEEEERRRSPLDCFRF